MNSGIQWRTREGPASLIPVQIKIPVNQTIPIYQKLASKIQQMKALGMSYREIAACLGIDKKTVGRGLSLP